MDLHRPDIGGRDGRVVFAEQGDRFGVDRKFLTLGRAAVDRIAAVPVQHVGRAVRVSVVVLQPKARVGLRHHPGARTIRPHGEGNAHLVRRTVADMHDQPLAGEPGVGGVGGDDPTFKSLPAQGV
ncbi:hypothetical protein OIU13_02715 [Brevundimonas sp. BT-123]|uniref:hypothetical protein n=1 Tax=Brevundimonas sp. BT-123 TaxID=2986928 RepID=UPI002235D0E7|nr:hypothetical protein [Brevundimonas sp. BT-123]MCW0045443.1 hypothetical protein [Brevundimonas sp. BT-123]